MSRFVVVGGEKFSSVIKACEHFGVNYGTVLKRLRMGWSAGDAFLKPISKPIKVKIDGEWMSCGEASKKMEISEMTLRRRITRKDPAIEIGRFK